MGYLSSYFSSMYKNYFRIQCTHHALDLVFGIAHTPPLMESTYEPHNAALYIYMFNWLIPKLPMSTLLYVCVLMQVCWHVCSSMSARSAIYGIRFGRSAAVPSNNSNNNNHHINGRHRKRNQNNQSKSVKCVVHSSNPRSHICDRDAHARIVLSKLIYLLNCRAGVRFGRSIVKWFVWCDRNTAVPTSITYAEYCRVLCALRL